MFYTFILKWSLNPRFFLISKSLPFVECRQESFLGLGALLLIDIRHDIQKIDTRIAKSYFKDNLSTNLNQNPKGILLFFPNKSKIVKSYILLKIKTGEKILIIAMGSKDNKKFTPDQQVDLVEYLIKVIEIKINQLN